MQRCRNPPSHLLSDVYDRSMTLTDDLYYNKDGTMEDRWGTGLVGSLDMCIPLGWLVMYSNRKLAGRALQP
jgi:hypothetical protein